MSGDDAEYPAVLILAAIALLALSNVMANRVIPSWAYVPWNIAVAGLLLLLALRCAGTETVALCLRRERLVSGARWGGAVAGMVIVAYLIGLALPSTRNLFRDRRIDPAGWPTVYTALISVPFGTVLLEEVAFRSVLPTLIGRGRPAHRGDIAASLLFGIWHVLPAWSIQRSNPVSSKLLGGGMPGRLVGVGLAVGGTTIAGLFFCWLRRRSDSLLAPALVHFTTNSVGYVLASLVRH